MITADRFASGLRWVARLLLALLGAYLAYLVVVLADIWRSRREIDEYLVDVGEAEIARIADRADGMPPWDQPDARPLDDVRSALDLFERRYREQLTNPTLRWGDPSAFERGGASVEFAEPAGNDDQAVVEQFDVHRWLRDRRRHGPTPL